MASFLTAETTSQPGRALTDFDCYAIQRVAEQNDLRIATTKFSELICAHSPSSFDPILMRLHA